MSKELFDKIKGNRKEFDSILELLDRMIEYINAGEEIAHGFGLSLSEADVLWTYCMRLLSIQYPGRTLKKSEIYKIVWGLENE